MCLSLYSGSSYGSWQITGVTFCPFTFTYVFTNAHQLDLGFFLIWQLFPMVWKQTKFGIRFYLVVLTFVGMNRVG